MLLNVGGILNLKNVMLLISQNVKFGIVDIIIKIIDTVILVKKTASVRGLFHFVVFVSQALSSDPERFRFCSSNLRYRLPLKVYILFAYKDFL